MLMSNLHIQLASQIFRPRLESSSTTRIPIRMKRSADDQRHAKDLLAHYKKIQSSSDRADFVEKLKRYGIRGMPKMLEVVDSRMDVDDSLAVHVIKWMSLQQIFIAEGLLVSVGLRRNMRHISSGEDLSCNDIAGRLSQYGRHFL